jgi:hypothetical protein
VEPELILYEKYWLQKEIMEHKRKIFGWFGLLGKLGGITNIFMLLLGGIMGPISEHSFLLKASKKLFIARTKDPNIFVHDPNQKLDVLPLTSKAH